MIPTITPPTDNLYKFLSLFGLTIFLFSIYNLGIVYDRSSLCKTKLEDVKVEIQISLFESTNKTISAFQSDSLRFRPSQIRKLDEDLSKIKQMILKSEHLDAVQKIKLNGKVAKLSVQIDALFWKLWSYVGIMVIGIFIMIRGFFRWQKREQKFRDEILQIEHEMKEMEQDKLEKEIESNKK